MESIITGLIVLLEGAKSCKKKFLFVTILTIFISLTVFRQVLQPVSGNKGFIIASVEFLSCNLKIPTVAICFFVTNQKLTDKVKTGINTLEKQFTLIGFPLDYTELKRYRQRFVKFLIFKIIFQLLPFCFIKFPWHLRDYCDFLIHNIALIIFHLVVSQWVLYLALIGSHFSNLTNILSTLQYKNLWPTDIKKNRKFNLLKTCAIIFNDLKCLTDKINQIFEWRILFLIFTTFIQIIFYSFRISRMIKNQMDFKLLWIALDLLYFEIFLELVIPPILVIGKSQIFEDSLFKIGADTGLINLLLLQTHHQKIEFKSCGVFTLNGPLIYTILGALTTYLVILLQFDL